MEQVCRSAVLELHHEGHSGPDIVKILQYPKSTVYDIPKRFKMTGENGGKAHKTRSDKIHTPRFLAGLNNLIKAKPGKLQTMLAKRKGVSWRTT